MPVSPVVPVAALLNKHNLELLRCAAGCMAWCRDERAQDELPQLASVLVH